ncbi:hypothetical protein DIPPA_12446 [Diplonema papillatum]|nr:hypothetical protein DIPPA_12446 [Diplonema papillatum]
MLRLPKLSSADEGSGEGGGRPAAWPKGVSPAGLYYKKPTKRGKQHWAAPSRVDSYDVATRLTREERRMPCFWPLSGGAQEYWPAHVGACSVCRTEQRRTLHDQRSAVEGRERRRRVSLLRAEAAAFAAVARGTIASKSAAFERATGQRRHRDIIAAWLAEHAEQRRCVESDFKTAYIILLRDEAREWEDLSSQQDQWLREVLHMRACIAAYETQARERRAREEREVAEKALADRAEADSRRRKALFREEEAARRAASQLEEVEKQHLLKLVEQAVREAEAAQAATRQQALVAARKMKTMERERLQLADEEAPGRTQVIDQEIDARDRLSRHQTTGFEAAAKRATVVELRRKNQKATRDACESEEAFVRDSLSGSREAELARLRGRLDAGTARLLKSNARFLLREKLQARERAWMAGEDASSRKREVRAEAVARSAARERREIAAAAAAAEEEAGRRALACEREVVESAERRARRLLSDDVADTMRQLREELEILEAEFLPLVALKRAEAAQRSATHASESAAREELEKSRRTSHERTRRREERRAAAEARLLQAAADDAWLRDDPGPAAADAGGLLFGGPDGASDPSTNTGQRPVFEFDLGGCGIWVQGGGPVAIWPECSVRFAGIDVAALRIQVDVAGPNTHGKDTLGVETRAGAVVEPPAAPGGPSELYTAAGVFIGEQSVSRACEGGGVTAVDLRLDGSFLRRDPSAAAEAAELLLRGFLFGNEEVAAGVPPYRLLSVAVSAAVLPAGDGQGNPGEAAQDVSFTRRVKLPTWPPLVHADPDADLRETDAGGGETDRPFHCTDVYAVPGNFCEGVLAYPAVSLPAGHCVAVTCRFADPGPYRSFASERLNLPALVGEEEAVSDAHDALSFDETRADRVDGGPQLLLKPEAATAAVKDKPFDQATDGVTITQANLAGDGFTVEVSGGGGGTDVRAYVNFVLDSLRYQREARGRCMMRVAKVTVAVRRLKNTEPARNDAPAAAVNGETVGETSVNMILDVAGAAKGSILSVPYPATSYRLHLAGQSQDLLLSRRDPPAASSQHSFSPKLVLYPGALLRSDVSAAILSGSLRVTGARRQFDRVSLLEDSPSIRVSHVDPRDPVQARTLADFSAAKPQPPPAEPGQQRLEESRLSATCLGEEGTVPDLAASAAGRQEGEEAEEVAASAVWWGGRFCGVFQPTADGCRLLGSRAGAPVAAFEAIIRALFFTCAVVVDPPTRTSDKPVAWKPARGSRHLTLEVDLGFGSSPVLRSSARVKVHPPLLQYPTSVGTVSYRELSDAVPLSGLDVIPQEKSDELYEGAFVECQVLGGWEASDVFELAGLTLEEVKFESKWAGFDRLEVDTDGEDEEDEELETNESADAAPDALANPLSGLGSFAAFTEDPLHKRHDRRRSHPNAAAPFSSSGALKRRQTLSAKRQSFATRKLSVVSPLSKTQQPPPSPAQSRRPPKRSGYKAHRVLSDGVRVGKATTTPGCLRVDIAVRASLTTDAARFNKDDITTPGFPLSPTSQRSHRLPGPPVLYTNQACTPAPCGFRLDTVQSIVDCIRYKSVSQDPRLLRKVVLVTVFDGSIGLSHLAVPVAVETVNDSTEICVDRTAITYQQGSVGDAKGMSLFPGCRLDDPDSPDFSKGVCHVDLIVGGDGQDKLYFMALEQQDRLYVGTEVLPEPRTSFYRTSSHRSSLCEVRGWNRYVDDTLWSLDQERMTEEEAESRLTSLLWLTVRGDTVHLNNVPVATVTFKGTGVRGQQSSSLTLQFNCQYALPLACASYVLSCIAYENKSKRLATGSRTYLLKLNAGDGPVADSRLRVKLSVLPPTLWAPGYSLSWRYHENDGQKPINRQIRCRFRPDEAVTKGKITCALAEVIDRRDAIDLASDQDGQKWVETDGSLFLQAPQVLGLGGRRGSVVAGKAGGLQGIGRRGSVAGGGGGPIGGSSQVYVGRMERVDDTMRVQVVFDAASEVTGRVVELLARSFCFSNTSKNPTPEPRSIDIGYTEDSDDDNGCIVTTVVDVVPSDDLTEITIPQERTCYILGTPPVHIVTEATVTDPDTPVFEEGYLLVSFLSTCSKTDQLNLAPLDPDLELVTRRERRRSIDVGTPVGDSGDFPSMQQKSSFRLPEADKRQARTASFVKVASQLCVEVLYKGEVVGTVSKRARDGGLGRSRFKILLEKTPLRAIELLIQAITYANEAKRDTLRLSRSVAIVVKDGIAQHPSRATVSLNLFEPLIDLSSDGLKPPLKAPCSHLRLNLSSLASTVVTVTLEPTAGDQEAALSFSPPKALVLKPPDIFHRKVKIASVDQSPSCVCFSFAGNTGKASPDLLQAMLRTFKVLDARPAPEDALAVSLRFSVQVSVGGKVLESADQMTVTAVR